MEGTLNCEDIPENIRAGIESGELAADEGLNKESVLQRIVQDAFARYHSTQLVAEALDISPSRASQLKRKYVSQA